MGGDRGTALDMLDKARRVFDRAGSYEQISDFAVPEWRMATFVSMLLSRLGDPRAVEAQETADRTRPATLPRFATHIELHRALMMAKAGDKAGGAGARAPKSEEKSWFTVSIRRTAVRRVGRGRVVPAEPAARSEAGADTEGDTTMRFMVLVKADQHTEAGVMPSEELLTAMGKYNEELVKAGVLLAGEGLHPSSKGARVRFSGDGKTTVIDGPFAEAKELVAGFWLIQVGSKEEAIEWVRRVPYEPGVESEIEIRQVFEAEDFGPAFTPELREQEERLRAEVAAQQR